MLKPAVQVRAKGQLNSTQVQGVITKLQLDRGPRTEGPNAAQSIAHRVFTGPTGANLVVDLARTGTSDWMLTLFYDDTGKRPANSVVNQYRTLFDDTFAQAGLTGIRATLSTTLAVNLRRTSTTP